MSSLKFETEGGSLEYVERGYNCDVVVNAAFQLRVYPSGEYNLALRNENGQFEVVKKGRDTDLVIQDKEGEAEIMALTARPPDTTVRRHEFVSIPDSTPVMQGDQGPCDECGLADTNPVHHRPFSELLKREAARVEGPTVVVLRDQL